MKSAFRFFTVASLLGWTQAASNRLPLYLYVDGGSAASPSAIKDEFIKMADSGATTIIMAFYLTGGNWKDNMADMAARWSTLGDDDRKDIHDALKERGTTLLVSAGGASEGGDWQKHDPTEYGHTFCSVAKKLNLDGVDFDLEQATRVDATLSDWLHKSAVACKQVFPEAIITSAPQSPYFDPAQGGGSHGHGWDDILIDGQEDGSAHDHLLIQYYNQGEYYSARNYEDIFGTSKPYSIGYLMNTYPDAPSKTFVVGRTWLPADGASQDWIDPVELREMGCKAWNELNWRGGFMFWQHHFGADDSTFEKYSALVAPCDGGEDEETTSAPPKTTSTTRKRATTTIRTTQRTTTKKPVTTAKRTTSTPPKTRATTKPKTSVTTKTPRLRTTTKNADEDTTVVAPNDGIIGDCKNGIAGTGSQYDEGCQNLCDWYGGDGAPQCGDAPTTTDELIACIIRNNAWCQNK